MGRKKWSYQHQEWWLGDQEDIIKIITELTLTYIHSYIHAYIPDLIQIYWSPQWTMRSQRMFKKALKGGNLCIVACPHSTLYRLSNKYSAHKTQVPARSLFMNLGQGGASQVALVVKNPPANAGDIRDTSSIPGWGRSPGGRHGNSVQ